MFKPYIRKIITRGFIDFQIYIDRSVIHFHAVNIKFYAWFPRLLVSLLISGYSDCIQLVKSGGFRGTQSRRQMMGMFEQGPCFWLPCHLLLTQTPQVYQKQPIKQFMMMSNFVLFINNDMLTIPAEVVIFV